MDDTRGRSADNKGTRGRSAEARDPNRPIDPETGEKEGLGRRWDEDVDVDVDVNDGGEVPPTA